MKGLRIAIYGVLLGVLIGVGGALYGAANPEGKPSEEKVFHSVLRFHVRANSDSKEDQDVKLLVKQGVLDYLNPKLSQSASLADSLDVVEDEMDEIKNLSEDILKKNGFSESVKAYITTEEFPMKKYGDMTFPSGTYQALRIDIGEASGKNWWCMMYPPLCFVDVTYGVVPEDEKEKFQQMLPQEEYEEMVTAAQNDEVEYDFYLWNKLKEWFGK